MEDPDAIILASIRSGALNCMDGWSVALEDSWLSCVFWPCLSLI